MNMQTMNMQTMNKHAMNEQIMKNQTVNNFEFIEQELDWLTRLIATRIAIYFEHDQGVKDLPSNIDEVLPPEVNGAVGVYPELIRQYNFSVNERLVLILAFAPHVRPQILDVLCTRNSNIDRVYCEFGAVIVEGHTGFWPSVETAVFLLGGQDIEQRLNLKKMLVASEVPSPIQVAQVLDLSGLETQASIFNAALHLSDEFLSMVTLGSSYRPQFNHSFPAKLLTTPLEWDDLVLPDDVMHQIEEIRVWIEHHQTLLNDWQLAGKIQPGFRSLFYGPPGTGKTLTASLLGKITGLPVYRVDLAMVVSKYIGETEKNLAKVFDQAEKNEWILFFDEADALFGKRSETNSSNDRHANQEVAFLLQRIENFPGVVLLATNLKSNIDEAFARRFQSMVRFVMPGIKERELLWRKAFSNPQRVSEDVCFKAIAKEHELAGGAIINILRHATLLAVRKGNQQVELKDLQQGIRREFHKMGIYA
jgi:hypothetical protein